VLTEQPSANRRYRRNWSRSAGCLHKPRALNVLLALRDSTKPKLSDVSPTLGQILSLGKKKPTILRELVGRAKNPLNALLLALAIVSYSLGDIRAAAVIAIMDSECQAKARQYG
jgi:hypothetical protein